MTEIDSPGLIIKPEALQPETLRAVVEEFVTREGTDYGPGKYTLDDKVRHVMCQLRRGEAQLTYDPATGTVSIVARPSPSGRASTPR